MSKQSESKASQHYTTVQRSCATCKHLAKARVLSKWMRDENDGNDIMGKPKRWDIAIHGVEKVLRCSIGGFAVKRTASCNLHESKPT